MRFTLRWRKTCTTKDYVFFDITHGLRLQPLTAAFDLMHLRWLRDLKGVEIYNGVRELGRCAKSEGEKDVCPVARGEEISNVLKAIEAAATWHFTGDFKALGNCLELSESERADLEKIVLAVDLSQDARHVATRLREKLENRVLDASSVQAAVRDTIVETLRSIENDRVSGRMIAQSRFAFDHNRYAEAARLLTEGIVVSFCELEGERDVLKYRVRERIGKQIDDLFVKHGINDYVSFNAIKALRNATTHGTQEDWYTIAEAVNDPRKLRKLLHNAYKIAEKLQTKLDEQNEQWGF